MNIEEAIKQCNELINSDIIETMHCAKCEHYCKNECIEEGCLYNRGIETVLKELEKARYGRNFLNEYILAKEFTPEMLRKCLYDYVSKDKIRDEIEELEYSSWIIKDCRFDDKLQEKIFNTGVLFGRKVALQDLLEESD